jgi:hypothetical protein
MGLLPEEGRFLPGSTARTRAGGFYTFSKLSVVDVAGTTIIVTLLS